MKKTLSITLIVLISVSAYAGAPLNAMTGGGSFNAVVVEKDKKKLHLVRVSPKGVQELKTITVLTGKEDGDKRISGDAKTPEGVYHVTGFLSPQKLQQLYGDQSKVYGYGAFPINYPNFLDRLLGKSGGGIWLHGVENNRLDPATKGCVAFANDDVRAASRYLSAGTPVVITRTAIYGSSAQYKQMFEAARQTVMRYLQAWADSDYDNFRDAYSRRFRSSDGRSLSSYLAYKKGLMNTYPIRSISADDFRVFYESPNEAVVMFSQHYSTDSMSVYGHKTLYLSREDGMMKIVAEDFEQTKGWTINPKTELAKAPARKPEKPVVVAMAPKQTVPEKPELPVVAEPVKPAVKAETVAIAKPEPVKTPEPENIPVESVVAPQDIYIFVNEWARAWESQDIESYIALYGDTFRSGGMNLAAWKKDKGRKFSSLPSISVDVSGIKAVALSQSRVDVTFVQKYTGGTYSDTGYKTLKLESDGENLHIIGEIYGHSAPAGYDHMMVAEAPRQEPAKELVAAAAPKPTAKPEETVVFPAPAKQAPKAEEPKKQTETADSIIMPTVSPDALAAAPKTEKPVQPKPAPKPEVKPEPVVAEPVKKPEPVKPEPAKPLPGSPVTVVSKETIVEPVPVKAPAKNTAAAQTAKPAPVITESAKQEPAKQEPAKQNPAPAPVPAAPVQPVAVASAKPAPAPAAIAPAKPEEVIIEPAPAGREAYKPQTPAPAKTVAKAPISAAKPAETIIESATPVKEPAKQPEAPAYEQSVADFIQTWKQAWESKDIDAYIAMYGDSFTSGRMDVNAWKADKGRKFTVIREIHVGIENMNIADLGGGKYEVTFLQRYSGDRYSDTGIKTMTLDSGSGSLKIVSEQWRAK